MPIPAPGNVDMANQSTLMTVKAKTDLIGASVALEAGGNIAAVKAKTDLIGASVALEAGGNIAAVKAKTDLMLNQYTYMQLLPRRGNAVQGTWAWSVDGASTEWLTDLKLDVAGFWRTTTAAINDEYAYPVFLPAGTYSVEIYYMKYPAGGIVTLKLGANTLGTVDTYGAEEVRNSVSTINFTVAVDTAANFRLVMASKNAAATAYALSLNRATLWRRT